MSAETAAIIDDMSKAFDSTEDIALIQSIRTNMADILQICQQKEQSVKIIIRELTNSVAALENQTTHSPEVVVKEKVAKVQEQVQKAEQQYHSMETKLQAERGKLQELGQQEKELDRQRDLELAKTATEVPAIRHQISLYACVSHLKWDFDAGDDIRGHVFFRNPDEIRPFHFPAHQALSDVEIADQLWSLMDR